MTELFPEDTFEDEDFDPDAPPIPDMSIRSDDEASIAAEVGFSFIAAVLMGKALGFWPKLGERFSNGFDGQTLWDWVGDKYVEAMRDRMLGPIMRANQIGHILAAEELGQPISQADWMKLIEPWAKVYAQQVAQQSWDQTAEAIQQSVVYYVNSGLRGPALGDRLRDVFGLDPRSAKTWIAYTANKDRPTTIPLTDKAAMLLAQRGKTIGDVQTFTSMNFGRQLLYLKAIEDGKLPRNARKVWVTALDERVCEICAPMDGRTVEIMDSFTIVLPKPKTSRGMPRKSLDILVPPVHPNCRCTIVPEVIYRQGMITRRARFSDSGAPSHRGRLRSDFRDLIEEVSVGKSFWDERLHPRDHGKFSSKPGAKGQKKDRSKRNKEIRSAAVIGGVMLGISVLNFRGSRITARASEDVDNFDHLTRLVRNNQVAGYHMMPMRAFTDAKPRGADPDEMVMEVIHRDLLNSLEGKTHDETINNLIKATRPLKYEHGFVVTDEGKILSGYRGAKVGVGFRITKDMADPEYRNTLTFFHNHPRQFKEEKFSPLSAADMKVFSSWGFKRMLAADMRGQVYELSADGKLRTYQHYLAHANTQTVTGIFSQAMHGDSTTDTVAFSDFQRAMHREMLVRRALLRQKYNFTEGGQPYVSKAFNPAQARDALGQFARLRTTQTVAAGGGGALLGAEGYAISQQRHRTAQGQRASQVKARAYRKVPGVSDASFGTPITKETHPEGTYHLSTDQLLAYRSKPSLHTPVNQKDLKAKIERYGFNRPIHLKVYDNGAELWDGNHRLNIADDLDIKSVPVKVVHYDGTRPREATVLELVNRLRQERYRKYLARERQARSGKAD